VKPQALSTKPAAGATGLPAGTTPPDLHPQVNVNLPFLLPDFLSSTSPATTPKLTDLQTCRRRSIAHLGAMPTSTPPTTALLCSEASGLRKVLPTPISIPCCRFSASLPILLIYATVANSWLRGMGNRLNQETTIFSLPVGFFCAFITNLSTTYSA